LLRLYQSDIGDRILSYASGQDLCTLDILNKQFNTLTTNQWKVVTKERFGMDNGKEGWKVGTSFLRPPSFVHNLADCAEPEPDDGRSPRIDISDNIVVHTSSNFTGQNNIRLMDAYTLKDIPHEISNPEFVDKVSICGRAGSEIVVASTYSIIEAEAVHWDREEDGDFASSIPPIQDWQYTGNSNNGIETIGCETHLITAHDGMIRLYEVNKEEPFEAGIQELFIPRNRIRVDEGVAEEEGAEDEEMKLAWGPDKTHFIVGCTHKICVLKLDANEISLVKTITVPNWEVVNVALAEDYIVASSKDKKVHIWNRSTGDKMVYGLQVARQGSPCVMLE